MPGTEMHPKGVLAACI